MNNTRTFIKMKESKDKIVMITAYDYPSASFVQEAKADIILVGDSLGMVVLGYPDTLLVNMEDMIHHSKAARRGAIDTFIVTDMPYRSYHISLTETKRNAFRIIQEGAANAVKLEGGSNNRIEAIKAIVDCEIPVVAHLGLTPQSIQKMGGYVVQGKKSKEYKEILQQSIKIQEAGAFMLVLEGIPEKLGKEISEQLNIPTIGIGAGRFTDGQVLVYHDLLGMYDFQPKFVKQYDNCHKIITSSLEKYVKEVKNMEFPQKKNVYLPIVE